MTSSRIPILFVTNSEYGQANVMLAVAQELASNPEFEIHVSAFGDLEERVSTINSNGNASSPIAFHPVAVASMADLIKRHTGTKGLAHQPGLSHTAPAFLTLQGAILGWEPSEYMKSYEGFLKAIQDVKPAALVIDPGLWQAHDAARTLGLNYLILSPSSPKDIVGTQMPKKPTFWKYPFPGSGYSYPLSFFGSIKNVLIVFGAIFSMLRAGYIQKFNKARKQANITHPFPMAALYRKEDHILTPYLPETDWEDYSAVGMPENHTGCGPIVLPAAVSLAESDPELSEWLHQASTILINLGTHFSTDPSSALEIAKGLKTVLDARPDVQVLWKLKYDWHQNSEIAELVQPFLGSKRLRITPWLTADPATILLEGNVVCSVHHGGANSYYEACRYGLPQLVLPVWFDTYEYAERANYLGIGLVGNVGIAPRVEAVQFGSKLLQILQDGTMQEKADLVGKACSKREGREVAAAEIAKWAKESKKSWKSE